MFSGQVFKKNLSCIWVPIGTSFFLSCNITFLLSSSKQMLSTVVRVSERVSNVSSKIVMTARK